MAKFSVPWPSDPDERRTFFERAARVLAKHGEYQGTPDAGSFRGNTPVGAFSGIYYSDAGADSLVIELMEKPWLVPVSAVESQVKKFLSTV